MLDRVIQHRNMNLNIAKIQQDLQEYKRIKQIIQDFKKVGIVQEAGCIMNKLCVPYERCILVPIEMLIKMKI